MASEPGGFFLFEGVVGGADERAGFYVLEAHGFACALEFGEFVGVDEALDWQVLGRGLQILAEREDVRALRGDFFHCGEDFVARFAEA